MKRKEKGSKVKRREEVKGKKERGRKEKREKERKKGKEGNMNEGGKYPNNTNREKKEISEKEQ